MTLIACTNAECQLSEQRFAVEFAVSKTKQLMKHLAGLHVPKKRFFIDSFRAFFLFVFADSSRNKGFQPLKAFISA